VKQVAVVPSRTIPQGLAAMLALQLDGEVDAVAEKMTKALSTVKSGEITVAVRNVEIDGVNVKEGQVIAILDGRLVTSTGTVEEGLLDMLEKAEASEHELVTLFYGQEMPHVEANRIADVVREKYSNLEVEVQEGGQPHYHFIVSVE
jgi:fatty acid kinase